MRLLLLSDTHLVHKQRLRWVEKIVHDSFIDIVVIAGDVMEMSFMPNINPYKMLARIIPGVKIIFCLGNHEFFGRTVSETLHSFSDKYNPDKYDVHCLDVIGHLDVDGLRFLGNVLWYDGSCGFNPNPYDWVGGSWMDGSIKDFDFMKENHRCIEQIKDNLNPSMTQVLVTHCVPHKKLNLHDETSPYNVYSGVDDLFSRLTLSGNALDTMHIDYSISGHTHRRTVGGEIHGTACINVGESNGMTKDHFILEHQKI